MLGFQLPIGAPLSRSGKTHAIFALSKLIFITMDASAPALG